MKRHGWWVALAVVLLANTVALVGAALNRAGEPEAMLELTERELPRVQRQDDDSGTSGPSSPQRNGVSGDCATL